MWLRERRLKPRTREGYEHLLRRYLLPAFGHAPLALITPSHVRQWWVSLDDNTPTINARAYALLKAILNTAVADEELVANPCRIRSASSAPRARDIRPATIEELSIIVAALPENRRAIALLCSWCAMRIGEVLELRRRDLDLRHGVVRIERAVARVAGRPVVGHPKSAAGRRVVAIPPHVVPALEQHLDLYVARGANSLLFPAGDGHSHLQPTVFNDAFRKARDAAGRDDLRVHDLRHTGATLAAMTGATLAELQQRLGHSTVVAALRYQHAAQGRDAEIAEALSRLADGRRR
jgi:integrase